jgi:hypothetical protein
MRELARATNERRLATSARHSNKDESTDIKSTIVIKCCLKRDRNACNRARCFPPLPCWAAAHVAAASAAAHFTTETWLKKQVVPVLSQTRAEEVYLLTAPMAWKFTVQVFIILPVGVCSTPNSLDNYESEPEKGSTPIKRSTGPSTPPSSCLSLTN